MKNIDEFVEKLVEIRYISDFNCFGHYPFQLFAETNEGKFEMNALLLGGDVQSVYQRIKHYIDNNAKKIFLSCDFPVTLDSKNDFVMIYSIVNNELTLFAIPYNSQTGETFPRITKGKFVDALSEQFKLATGFLLKNND